MVDNVGGVGRNDNVTPRPKTKAVYHIDQSPAEVDSVELSSDVMRLNGITGVRMDKVMEIRGRIAAGAHFTAEKLDRALDLAIDDALRT